MTMELSAAIAGGRLKSERLGGEGVSSLLVAHFEHLVHAPGSAKLLKELVLHLAMQGRLSESQGESVEPLRVEVRRARDRLAKSGVRVRDLPPVDDADVPWSLPAGWAWVRLGELGGFLGGGTPSKSNSSLWAGPLPWVSPKDMKQPYIDDAEDHISMAAVEESAAKLIPKTSVLCVVRGMILAHSFPVALTRREVAINQDMKALVLAVPAIGEFVLRACQDARARVLASVERSSHGTCRLAGEVVESLLIPLPPLAEQKRIVAKVDQLMALCDDLEARQTKKRETSTRLTKSALQALTTAESPEDFDRAWTRVVENFDVLIDRAEKVGTLRKLVLEVAMRGALVARTAEGPSAAQLLADAEKKVRDARSRIRGRRVEAPAEVQAQEHPPLPPGWLAVRWSQVGLSQNGRAFPSDEYSDAGVRLLRPGNIHVSGEVRWTPANTRHLPHQYADRFPEFIVRRGELIMNLTAQSLNDEFLGRVSETVTDEHCLLNQRLARLTPLAFDRRFLLWFFRCPFFRSYVDELNQGTLIQHMFTRQVDAAVVFLPPLPEQVRIAAKIDQLMKVCDDLEARLTRAEDRATKLVEAVVRDLVE